MSGGTHLIWITSRAAGITALVLASLSVCVGLLISRRGRRGPDLKTTHEALSLATLAAVGIHGVAVMADPWLKPGLAGVLVPFQIAYRPTAVAAGIVAAFGLAALGLSYYGRGRLGPARWRRMHRWTALFWALAVVHGFTAGSDAGKPWFILSVGAVVTPALLLLATRTMRRGSSASELPAMAATTGTG
jgi:methionine sulfoxide reductase heme-binding subunit